MKLPRVTAGDANEIMRQRPDIINLPNKQALRLIDLLDNEEWSVDLARNIVQAVNESTDGQPRYVVIRISNT
jgi:hypothetical protein